MLEFIGLMNFILLVSLIAFTFNKYNNLCNLGAGALIAFWFMYIGFHALFIFAWAAKRGLI